MYPNTNLQPGQTGAEVKKLQDFLVSKGLMTPQEVATGPGIYGPRTTAAVKKFQEQNGVDNTSGPGYWGPRTRAAATGAGASSGSGDSNSQITQQSIDNLNNEIKQKAQGNQAIQQMIQGGNDLDSILNAFNTGDWSGVKDIYGQPFDVKSQQEAYNKAEKDTAAFYEAQKSKETADAEAALAQKQADFQNYLLTSQQNFESDKATADQSAADRGVLFSGGRVQKEKNLQRSYEQDQAYKLGNISRDIASTARDFQYKYGNDVANSLSQYYKLGQNTFNPNVATGGVGSGGLSKVYNPSNYNLGSGSRIKEQQIDINTRAARALSNKGNKLLATGYQNKY